MSSNITPTELVGLLGRLPLDHPLILAARTGIEIASRGTPPPNPPATAEWDFDCRRHRHHDTGPSSIRSRRYPPNGDVDEWITYGPAGAPPQQAGGAAD